MQSTPRVRYRLEHGKTDPSLGYHINDLVFHRESKRGRPTFVKVNLSLIANRLIANRAGSVKPGGDNVGRILPSSVPIAHEVFDGDQGFWIFVFFSERQRVFISRSFCCCDCRPRVVLKALVFSTIAISYQRSYLTSPHVHSQTFHETPLKAATLDTHHPIDGRRASIFFCLPSKVETVVCARANGLGSPRGGQGKGVRTLSPTSSSDLAI